MLKVQKQQKKEVKRLIVKKSKAKNKEKQAKEQGQVIEKAKRKMEMRNGKIKGRRQIVKEAKAESAEVAREMNCKLIVK